MSDTLGSVTAGVMDERARCARCREEMPLLDRTAAEHREVAVLEVDLDLVGGAGTIRYMRVGPHGQRMRRAGLDALR